MYVWFIGLNHSKYRFPFNEVYSGITAGESIGTSPAISPVHLFLLGLDTGTFRRIGCRFVCFFQWIHGATFLRLIVSYTVVKRVCLVLCFKPFKISFSVSCGLYRDNERNKKTCLSCCKIQPGEIPWFRCPLQTAPVRTDGFFLPCPVLKKVYRKE